MKNNLFKNYSEAENFYMKEIQSNQSKLLYFKGVLNYLEIIIPDQEIIIKNITKAENIGLFMQCISISMYMYQRNICIVFNDDYTKFKKRDHDFKHFAYTHKEVLKCDNCEQTTTA